MKSFRNFSVAVLLLTLFTVFAYDAQAQRARPSQRGHVEQTVGTTKIMITYHRPNAKGRVLWGDSKDALVPNGKVWRAGANEATVFEVSSDVMINGKPLPAGKYSFYAIPAAGEWTLMFNKTWEQWGTVYDEKQDALRVMSKPVMSEESKESLSYVFEDVDADSTVVVLQWGKARIPFTVSTVPAPAASESK